LSGCNGEGCEPPIKTYLKEAQRARPARLNGFYFCPAKAYWFLDQNRLSSVQSRNCLGRMFMMSASDNNSIDGWVCQYTISICTSFFEPKLIATMGRGRAPFGDQGM
jgi:hypothetical protein